MQVVADWKDFNFSKHIFFNCSNEINNIIQPLAKYFDLDSFVFQKIYADGSEIRLTNQPQWAQHFYVNKLYQSSIFEANAEDFKQQFTVWAHIPEHSPVLNEARKFGIDYGVTLANAATDGMEFYFLGTTSGKAGIMKKYLANLDLLEKFTLYFKQTASSLIDQAYRERLLINKEIVLEHKQNPIDKDDFLLQLMQITMTSRELDCAKLLARGFTAKMIALQLNLSYRTVEEYINRLKEKSGQYSKAELTDYFNQWFS